MPCIVTVPCPFFTWHSPFKINSSKNWLSVVLSPLPSPVLFHSNLCNCFDSYTLCYCTQHSSSLMSTKDRLCCSMMLLAVFHTLLLFWLWDPLSFFKCLLSWYRSWNRLKVYPLFMFDHSVDFFYAHKGDNDQLKLGVISSAALLLHIHLLPFKPCCFNTGYLSLYSHLLTL